MCVYKITNLVNRKVYIGKTIDYVKRIQQHLNPKRFDFPIMRAVKKYGSNNFSCEILERVLFEDILMDLEKKYISLYKSKNPKYGYNCTDGGEGLSGAIQPTRWKTIYQFDKTHKLVKSYKSMGEAEKVLGYKPTLIELGAKTSHGFIFSKNEKLPDGFCHEKVFVGKPVHQYSMCGKLVSSFNSIKEAKCKTGIKGISKVIGGRYAAGGYLWSRQICDVAPYKRIFGGKKPKPISVFDIQKMKLFSFESVSSAANYIGCDHSSLSRHIIKWSSEINFKSRFIIKEGELSQKYIDSRLRVICQYDKCGQKIAEYGNHNIASKLTGLPHGNILACLKRKKGSLGGYIWKYK